MNTVNINELIELMSKSLEQDRFYHSIGVSDTAACLAVKYDYDINKARIAGLIHDYAKRDSVETYIDYCIANNINITLAERANPQLLHAKIGAYLAENELKINDSDILSAITYHTTGRPNMSLLDKIIYIADYIEPGRYKQPNLLTIRKEAFENLDKCMYMILDDTVKHLKSKNYAIDTITEDTYNYYKGNY